MRRGGGRSAGYRGGGGRGGRGGRGGQGGGQGGRAAGICHQWRDTGTCCFGSSCRFHHVGGPRDAGGGGGAVRIRRSNDDTSRFIQHLLVFPVQKLGSELVKSSSLWHRCWQDHKTLDDQTRRMMLEVLAKTPGSCSIEPPPIQLCRL